MGLFQSYGAGLSVICDAPDTAPELAQAPPEQKSVVLAKYIEENLYNKEAIELFTTLGAASEESKFKMLRKAAKKAGLQQCKLADQLEESYLTERKEQASYLCELPSCESFVASDPNTLLPCAKPVLSPAVHGELEAMNRSSPAGLARDIRSFIQPFNLPSCELALALQNAQ